jgi:uncharacterized protein (DUF983 family)
MLLRGAFRHCAWCGGRGAFFVGWFKKAECCQSCGLKWRRDDVGYELGAAAMTAIITFGPLMLILGGMVAVTWPDVNVVPMFIVLAVLAVVLPFFTYGPAYCMWQAVDILLRPPEPGDFEIVGDVTPDPAPDAASDAASDSDEPSGRQS